jgi:hypothetical protein
MCQCLAALARCHDRQCKRISSLRAYIGSGAVQCDSARGDDLAQYRRWRKTLSTNPQFWGGQTPLRREMGVGQGLWLCRRQLGMSGHDVWEVWRRRLVSRTSPYMHEGSFRWTWKSQAQPR